MDKKESLKEMIEMVNKLDKKSLNKYINKLFSENVTETDYSRLINVLISSGVSKEDILIGLSKNIDNVLKKYQEKRIWDYDFIEIINVLLKDANLEDVKKAIIEAKINSGYIKNYKKLLKISDYKMSAINLLLRIGLPIKYVIEERNVIKEHIKGKDYLDFIKLINSYNVKFDQEPTTEEFLRKMFSSPNDYSIVQNIPKLIIVLEEQMELENVGLYDLSILGAGEYSQAIKVGNYAVKMGTHRENDDVPRHPKIINSAYWTLLTTDIYQTFVEVQECVDNNWYKDLSEEEIIEKEYELFKELKEDGISWIDVKKENIGMKKGELIVIDKDHLYRNGNEAMRLPTKYIDFMMRYNKEKKVRKKEVE